MTTQPHTQRSLTLRLARAIGLSLALPSALFVALLVTLSPAVVETAAVQAAVVQVQPLRAVAQPPPVLKEYICQQRQTGVVTFTNTPIEKYDCERYAAPPSIGLDESGVVFVDGQDFIHSVALANVDGDGDLDITVASGPEAGPYHRINLKGKTATSIKIHVNQSGRFLADPIVITESEAYTNVAKEIVWGDVDNDGDLDLAAGTLRDDVVYIMEGLQKQSELIISDTFIAEDYGYSERRTTSVAWGDIDGDGKLELVLGNYGRPKGYANQPVTLEPVGGINRIVFFQRDETGATSVSSQVLLTNTLAWTTDQVWSDVDNDTDLDLIVGLATYTTTQVTTSQPINIQIYKNNPSHFNQNLLFESIPITEIFSSTTTFPPNEGSVVASADIDRNGFVDLAVVYNRFGIEIFYDHSSPLATICKKRLNPPPNLGATELHSLSWGDVDGDGDLDLAAGFQHAPDRIYLNQKGCINPEPAWESEYDPSDPKSGTRSLAWGDMDNDGDLDLVAGGLPVGQIYYNNAFAFKRLELPSPAQTSSESASDRPLGYVTLGDVDNDGDLDIARQVYSQPVAILINQHGKFSSAFTVAFSSAAPLTSYVKLHLGDVNRDSFLDLVVTGQYTTNANLYVNDQGTNFAHELNKTLSAIFLVDGSAMGDIDHDQQIELISSNSHQFYRYDLAEKQFTTIKTANRPRLVELGDVDNDGDLDIVATNLPTGSTVVNEIHIYENNPREYVNGFTATPTTVIQANAQLRGLAWGDVNGDGYLDLAAAVNGFDQVYLNQAGTLTKQPVWRAAEHDNTWRLAWADADGDGDLDLATGSTTGRTFRSQTIYRVYRNDNGILSLNPAWESDPVADSTSIVWGDLDDDGIPELVTPGAYYKLNRPIQQPLTEGFSDDVDPRIAVAIDRFSNPITPSATITILAIANFHAMPFVREQPTIPVTFTLFHPLSQTFDKVQVYYSLNGGGQWFTATGSLTHDPLTSSPFPTRTAANTHVFEWDVIGSNIFGQYQDVVIRIEAYPSLPITGATKLYTNSVPTISLVPSVASQTYPFRLQGKQIQVRGESGKPMVGALVYRRAGSDLGKPLGGSEAPFVTDKDGYLQGRGEIQPGDYLLALAPIITYTEKMTWAKGLTDTLHVYQTNGSQDGDSACQVSHKVTAATTEVLTVTASCPLVLHDLDIALEWDASKDPRYLEQLQFNLQRASQYLYSFTRGQMALGKLNIFQDADLWGYAHVNIHANNRLRPYAVIGGVTMAAATRIISHPTNITETRTYSTGQLHMGAVWNRYGEPNPNPGDDWSLVFAHELGHYLLFLDDTYIGLTNTVNITGQVAITEPVLIKVDDCIGSAMGDVYTTKNHGFIYNEARWDEKCAVTLANLQLNSPEWETIQYWYPLLVTTTAELTSAVPISYQFSSITIHDPITPTTVLANQDFYLKYENGEVGTSEARAFVVRDGNNNGSDDYIFDLGSPIGTQNLLRARGVQPGDQLCVFDRPRQHFGCERVTADDEEIQLYQDQSWNPVVQVTPLTALTFTINVTNSAAPTQPLELLARIFPEYGEGSQAVSLQPAPDGQRYSGIITLTAPAMAGHVQIVNTNNYTTQQAIVAFSIGGNPGDHKMAGGGDRRGGGGNPGDHKMAGGGNKWSLGGGHGDHKMAGGGDFSKGEAPFISPDGQMIFFATDPIHLAVGEFYLIQDMAGLPMPPANTVAIGRGHNLMNSGAVTDFALLSGSISFQYSGLDVLIEKVEEHALNIYYSSAGKPEWKKLPTYRDPYFNLVSARSVGAGIYALFADRRYRNIIDVSPRSVAAGNPITITGNNFRSSMLLALISDDEIRPYLLTSTFVDTTTLQVTLPDYVLSGVYYLEAINTDTIKETTGITLNVTNE